MIDSACPGQLFGCVKCLYERSHFRLQASPESFPNVASTHEFLRSNSFYRSITIRVIPLRTQRTRQFYEFYGDQLVYDM